MRLATRRYRELMAITMSNGHKTANWMDENNIDMTSLTVQSTALENALELVSMDV